MKPIALMRWLVRLITPPGGLVLDPFGGSGTTAVACVAEGAHFLLCEREEEYAAIAEARIRHALREYGHAPVATAKPAARTPARRAEKAERWPTSQKTLWDTAGHEEAA